MNSPGAPTPPQTHPRDCFLGVSTHENDPIRDNGLGTRRPQGVSLEQQKLDLLGPAYVLEKTREQRQFSRRRIVGVEDLRASISQRSETEKHRLFVIQGLPAEYLAVLRDTLNIDPRFVEAHVSRRRGYRPWVGRRRKQRRDDSAARSACFEYPELLSSRYVSPDLTATVKEAHRQEGEDVVGKPPVHVMSSDGDVAVFCCASLWVGSNANVLLLDRPVRTQSSSRPDNAPYRSSELSRASTIGEINETKYNHASSNDETASFETLLYENLAEEWREGPTNDEDTLRPLVEDIAIHQWTEFFDALTTDLVPDTTETTAIYWQMQKSLERNLSSSEFYDKLIHPSSSSSSTSDWQALLSRLTRRVELSRHLATPSTNATSLPPNQPSPPATATIFPQSLLPQPNNNNSSNTNSAEKNQHSLDRVSYMGGVLLPLSIVSSILSMSDPFGPTGDSFFVFWAASIPLMFVTLFVIYADSIRKAEVWIEVATSGGSSGPGSDVENPEDLDHGHEHNATVQVPAVAGEPKAGRFMGLATFGDEYGHHLGVEGFGSLDEPSMMAEKLFGKTGGDGGRRKWQKQQLGWKGACLTAFQLYKLKKGRPPNWGNNVRRERTN